MGTLMYEHISWQDDSLTIRLFVEKNDQEGRDCKPKHVFANPVKPWICPVLALAVYIFTAGQRQPGAKMLLFGNDSAEDRFSTWLRAILRTHEAPLQAMGIVISNIGTHSFRKGTATWLAGMVDGPSGVQIYLRAGWSLGMQKQYIFEGGGSDRHVGRAATGLTLDSEEFGCLPPHFNNNEGEALSNDEWEDILPGFLFYPEQFRVALPFLLASLLHHHDYILQDFAPDHPIRSSRLFTLPGDRLSQIKARVHAGMFKNTATGMVAKGVPQQVCILQRLDQLEQGNDNTANKLLARLDQVPEELTQCMLNRFQVNGAQPLLENRVQEMISSANNSLREVLLSEIRSMQAVASITRQDEDNAEGGQGWPAGRVGADGHKQWSWGGRFHPVPKGWSLPKGNVSMLFNLWTQGNAAMGLAPYRFLKSWDLVATEEQLDLQLVLSSQARFAAVEKVTKNWKGYLSQAHDVMLVIQEGTGMTFAALAMLSAGERERKFIALFTAMCQHMHPNISDEERDALRLNEMSYLSIYSALSKKAMLRKTLGKRKKPATEEEEEESM